MALFGFKNKITEYVEMESFDNKLNNLLSLDDYISKKEYISLVKEYQNVYNGLNVMKEKDMLYAFTKKNRVNHKNLELYMYHFETIKNKIKAHNETYIYNHLNIDKEYLDNILKNDDPNILLDNEQRTVVLSDEDYTLVVAGAGAGKTTTIEAKVKYLVDKKNIDPERILVISYTKKATKELKERFDKLDLNVVVSTFHSLGNTIINNHEKKKHKIVSPGYMYDILKDYLTTKLDDEYFIRKILLFFASYLNMPMDESNTALLFKSLANNGLSTLKSDLEEMIKEVEVKSSAEKITILNERVRSVDECRIANFLYINGINYIYEPVYRFGFKDSIKPYCPDFLLKQGDKEVYLEHFGISEKGENNRFTPQELEDYKHHVNDKILLHREHGTKLIFTFTKYNDNVDLITHLEKLLKENGFVFNEVPKEQIYKKIIENAENKYFSKFLTLICNFISKFKVNNFSLSKFDEWKLVIKDERTKLFIDICYNCYLAYQKSLKDDNAIDFEDMINNAATILDTKIENKEKLPYDYILVDEYQDISMQRFDLCEKLSKASDAKIIAVGDDWQSIYRFSGAKINLFTKFEEKMGYANILKITNTYRNSQELIDIAGGFIMENDKQIEKSLKSNKTITDPVILMSYDDSYEKDYNNTPFGRLGEAIEKSLDQIVLTNSLDSKVLLIGRYGYEGKNLAKLEQYFSIKDDKIISKKYPKLKIKFMTAHSSKGLGFDNVIIINGKDDIMGFPSKIEDDPVMKLVIKNDEEIEYAEERRLFYVALTRTKNRVYIITPITKPSKFILEIKDQFTNVLLNGTELNPNYENDYRRKCPHCGYPLQRRTSRMQLELPIKNLWICSNDPEVCGFMTNDLSGGKLAISKCPECVDGYLIVKRIKDKDGNDTNGRILGCTNYKKDGTGCNGHLNPYNFTQDKNRLAIEFYNPNMSLDKMIYMDFKIKDLIYGIIDIIKNNRYVGFDNEFSFTTGTLTDFLIGRKSKAMIKFNLDSSNNFGIINERYEKHCYRFIKILTEVGIFKEDENNFRCLILKNENPSDQLIQDIFSYLVK